MAGRRENANRTGAARLRRSTKDRLKDEIPLSGRSTDSMAWLHPVFWFALIFSCFVMASTAPATGKRRIHSTADETKVSTILSALSGEEKVLSRSKRHVPADAMTSELLAAIDADPSATSSQRRQRRSAVFYLTASMQFCKNYPIYCRRIEVDEGDVKVKIRLAEE